MYENEKYEKIAIMGGTFDPIHYGHLASAETVRHEFAFDKIIFIPSGRPPHKKQEHITDPELRYVMTSLATVSNPYFDVSRIEIERKGDSFTIDTVREIKKACDYLTKIYFITGADALLDILTWRDYVNLFKLCSLIAITRPGWDKSKLLKQIEYLKNEADADITFLEVPALSISSSDIRRRVKSGMPIKYLVPNHVLDYILKHGLYK